MSFELIPGNALGCRTNAHRHGWNGNICQDAATWSCGIDQEFREKYCANGVPRCFHLHILDEADPYLVIPDSGVGWIFDANPRAFEDQILLVWAPEATEPHGAIERPSSSLMAGAYRIRAADRIEHRNHVEWQIRPHADGWTYLGPLGLPAPRFIHLGGPYIKQVDRAAVTLVFERALELAGEDREGWTAAHRARLEAFAGHLDEWLTRAAQLVPPPALHSREQAMMKPAARPAARRSGRQPFQDVEPQGAGRPGAEGARAGTRLLRRPARALPPRTKDLPEPAPLVEESKRAAIAATYGQATLTALMVGALTKPLVILAGDPGVGKSRVALDLIDDEARERTLVVPVSSTWRGREDLLGSVNPIDNTFEPTELASFLRDAQEAWDAGDGRTRVVAFEDFNLSQPEYWLNEILVRSQYPRQVRKDRTIELGGKSVRGWDLRGGTHLFLSPAVRFVATIAADHTTQPLSQRVLDRAAVIRLELDARKALACSGVTLEPEQVDAIAELDRRTRGKRAIFSFRAALSLKACLERLDELGIDAWQAIDIVLRQGVLTKVALNAPDPGDRRLCARLREWSENEGKELVACGAVIASWEDLLEAGVDVRQA